MNCWNPLFNEYGKNEKNLLVIGGTHASENSSWATLAEFPLAFGSGNGGALWPYGTTNFYAYIVTPDRDYITITYQTYHSLTGVKNKLSEAGFVYDPDFGDGDNVTVTSPNGGEEYLIGDEMQIQWSSSLSGSVDVSLIGGANTIPIQTVSASAGSLTWTIPGSIETGSNYRIAISNGSVSDESNGTFSITEVDSCHLLIPQNKIRLSSFDSEQSGEEASNVLDGDKSTYWHTEWSPNEPDFPHEIVMKLDKTYGVSGLKYTPRQNAENGRIDEYEIYVTSDTLQWGIPVKSGRFQNSTDDQMVLFDSTGGEYVKFVALSEVNGNSWASAAELNLYHDVHYTGVSVVAKATIHESSIGLQNREGHLFLKLNGSYDVSLFTVSGRLLSHIQGIATGSEVASMSVGDIAKGVYILQITCEGVMEKRVLRLE